MIPIQKALRLFYRLDMPYVTGRGPLLDSLVVSDPKNQRKKIRVYIAANSKSNHSQTIMYSLPIKNGNVDAVKWLRVIELCQNYINEYLKLNPV